MVTIKNVTVYISLAMEHVKFVEILLFELVSSTNFLFVLASDGSVCVYDVHGVESTARLWIQFQ